MNPMNEVRIEKATVSIGVGEAGEKLIQNGELEKDNQSHVN